MDAMPESDGHLDKPNAGKAILYTAGCRLWFTGTPLNPRLQLDLSSTWLSGNSCNFVTVQSMHD